MSRRLTQSHLFQVVLEGTKIHAFVCRMFCSGGLPALLAPLPGCAEGACGEFRAQHSLTFLLRCAQHAFVQRSPGARIHAPLVHTYLGARAGQLQIHSKRGRNEVWAGPQAGEGGLIQSNTYIK